MAMIKVHEIAKEFDIKSSEVIEVLAKMGVEGKTASSGLEDDQAEAVRKKLSGSKETKPETPAPAKKPEAAPAPAKSAEATPAKSTGEEGEKPVKKVLKKVPPEKGAAPAAGVPVKKKKPIIVVSSARNGQVINRGGQGQQRGQVPVRPGQRTGIIRPTVPTTAERAARFAENNQGGDKDRLRRTGTAPKKENTESDKTDINTAGNNSGSTGSTAGGTGAPRQPQAQPAARPEAGAGRGTAAPAPAATATERPARPERRGGIVINQGRGFNASGSDTSKDNTRRGPMH